MRKEFSFFYADANWRMTVDTTKLYPDDGNVGAFREINTVRGANSNCLVFLSGMKELNNTWKIKPRHKYQRIVVASLQGTDFSEAIDDRGVAINVSSNFTEPENVKKLITAILEGFVTSSFKV
ncbi:unnamed protein product [Strongylus vulgaris]|uniref:Uncharacterized protein n=1 Tax=Strongylus vulgaris TaxID=40348 RepID=A0A3P7JEU7_STRVU|nr:unnamed protein product [Strongylus vulgaris]